MNKKDLRTRDEAEALHKKLMQARSRALIEARALPSGAELILCKTVMGVAALKQKRSDNERRKLNDRLRGVSKTLEKVQRHLSKARACVKSADRRRTDPFKKIYLAMRILIGDTIAQVQRMDPSMPNDSLPRRGRGAPSLPEDIYVLGATAINALVYIKTKRSDAARAVAACLKPLLPQRRKPARKDNYEFTGRSLLRWMAKVKEANSGAKKVP